MIRDRLENKIFWLVMIPLIVSLAVLVILGIDKSTREILKREREKLGILSRAVSRSILTSLRRGGPHELGGLVGEFHHMGEVQEVVVLRPDGRLARGAGLGFKASSSPGEGGSEEPLPISRLEAFRRVVEGGETVEVRQLDAEPPRYTALLPLPNGRSCRSCHGEKPGVIGVLKVSTSLAETLEEIQTVKFRLIVTSVLSVFIIGAILRGLLKVFILKPISDVVSTIREMAAGDLSRELRVNRNDELGQLAADFNRMAASLRRSQQELREWNIRLDQEVKRQTANLQEANLKLQAQQERIHRDLKLAEKVQASLIPHPLVLDGLEVGVTYIPHLEIGGDAAEIYALDDRRAYVACFDVTGHGIAAALVSSSIQGEVRRLMREGASPGKLLVELNNFLAREFRGTGMYASFVCGLFDLDEGTLTYAGGAHPAPLHWQSGRGRVEALELSGRLLGIFEEMEKPSSFEATVALEPGDRVIFYTDGVVEVTDESQTRLGREGLEALVAQNGSKPLEDLMAEILGSIAAFNASETFRDDVLLMVAGIRPDASVGSSGPEGGGQSG